MPAVGATVPRIAPARSRDGRVFHRRGAACLAVAPSAFSPVTFTPAFFPCSTGVQQHFSMLFFARVQYSLPPRFSQQHVSTSFPVREQRIVPVLLAVAAFFVQQAGAFGASLANAATLRATVQHRVAAVLLAISPPPL